MNPPTVQRGGGIGGSFGYGGVYDGNQAYWSRGRGLGGLGGDLGALWDRGGGDHHDTRGRSMCDWGRSGQDMQTQQGTGMGSSMRERNHAGKNPERGGRPGLVNGPLGLSLTTPQTAIRKLLKKVRDPLNSNSLEYRSNPSAQDVLYLIIVNMPSEASMAAATAATGGQGR